MTRLPVPPRGCHAPCPIRTRRGTLVVLTSCLLLVLVQGLTAQAASDDQGDHARQMHKRIGQLHDLLRERERARQAHEGRIQTLQDQVDLLQDQQAQAAGQLQRYERDVATKQTQVQQLQETRAALVAPLNATAEAARPVADAMLQRVAQGVPFQRESRRQTLYALRDQLDAIDDPVTQSHALTGLWSVFEQELAWSGSVRLDNQPATLPDGRRVQGYQLRLGLIQQLLVSEDGRDIAIADETGNRWRTDLTPSQRDAVVELMRVMQQQRPPRFVPAPLGRTHLPKGPR